jgi:ATP-dependent Clp protease ATP-binding subunit ClpA
MAAVDSALELKKLEMEQKKMDMEAQQMKMEQMRMEQARLEREEKREREEREEKRLREVGEQLSAVHGRGTQSWQIFGFRFRAILCVHCCPQLACVNTTLLHTLYTPYLQERREREDRKEREVSIETSHRCLCTVIRERISSHNQRPFVHQHIQASTHSNMLLEALVAGPSSLVHMTIHLCWLATGAQCCPCPPPS